MKIGIVCYPTFGGSGVVATELGKALAKQGHQIHFITYSQPQRLDFFNENLYYHEVNIPAYPLFQYPPYESALSSHMVHVVKMEKLDLLHVHYAIPHASSAYLAKQILAAQGIHIPVITTLHGTDITLVGKDESYEYARRLAKEEGILAGVSTGAALAAVAKKLPELPKGSKILTYNYDTGERYLSIEGFFA